MEEMRHKRQCGHHNKRWKSHPIEDPENTNERKGHAIEAGEIILFHSDETH